MPKRDWDKVPDSESWIVPAGEYLCEVTDVETSQTQYGDEMWSLKLTVKQGEFAGKWFFDRLIFSEKGVSRVKLVCGKFGIELKGQMDLEPEHLLNRCALVTTDIDTYEHMESGQMRKRNNVPFDGYRRAADGPKPPPSADPTGDLPF